MYAQHSSHTNVVKLYVVTTNNNYLCTHVHDCTYVHVHGTAEQQIALNTQPMHEPLTEGLGTLALGKLVKDGI